EGRTRLCRDDEFGETSKWEAAWPGRRQGPSGKSGSVSAKDSQTRRIEEPDTGDGRRDQGILRHGCAPEKCARDGAASNRHAENENRKSFRFASSGKGTRTRPRRNREDAWRNKVLRFTGADCTGNKLTRS